MKLLLLSSLVFATACGVSQKDDRAKVSYREANPSSEMQQYIDAHEKAEATGATFEHPLNETYSTNDQSAGEKAEKVAEKTADNNETAKAPAPKQIEKLKPVNAPAPVATALKAALETKKLLPKHSVYGFKWDIAPAAVIVKDNVLIVEGHFKKKTWDIDPVFFYEYRFVDGKLENADFFVKKSGSLLSLAAPIISGVGLYYGIPLPMQAIDQLVERVEALMTGNWEEAAQKLATRISIEAYRQVNLVDPNLADPAS